MSNSNVATKQDIEGLVAVMKSFKDDLSRLEKSFKDDLSRLERRVLVFESAPRMPVSRGGQYHGGVGVHSVSGATSGLKRYTR